ncbi:NADPH2:quinone reductase [Kribbella orskensis]|uniref:NADPH2:quinone reductase n=1 Tax=Kribbella orskensis TaxID=2512216 RepID=A0ABY2BU91_9ACTN|nr:MULTISPECIES: NADPH:quinone oxidoreductase family protein [Kribbella]TCN44628.1 NADPH2:quinone reductase [Kribbella sp. VKM Ac-2500]TCO31594.1 NADPH2:quinone reductase [Kribbella orskensis]
MRAIQVSRFGGPEVLVLSEVPAPVASADQLLVEVAAAGVNYADTHRTDGTYRATPKLPFIPGTEVVGRTPDGRRVLAPIFEGGGYAEAAVISAADAVEVPEQVGDGEALALLVQGLTAWHVLRSSARLLPGESVLVNAAAGGVGSLAVQLARHFGAARVIAAASTPAKRDLAISLGADAAVDSDVQGYRERVLAANEGRPVDVVLESTGGPAVEAALGVLAGFGRLISYGNAGRHEHRPQLDPSALADGNKMVGGFWLRPALELPGAYREPLTELLELTATGVLRPLVGAEYALADARKAHEDLLARRTTGKLVLRP